MLCFPHGAVAGRDAGPRPLERQRNRPSLIEVVAGARKTEIRLLSPTPPRKKEEGGREPRRALL